MYALFIILNDLDYLDDILTKFCELNVSGATILESQGMGSVIVQREMDSLPLFGSLKTLLKGARPYNKTIFTIIEDEKLLNNTITELQNIINPKDELSAGIMFTVPVGRTYPLKNSKRL